MNSNKKSDPSNRASSVKKRDLDENEFQNQGHIDPQYQITKAIITPKTQLGEQVEFIDLVEVYEQVGDLKGQNSTELKRDIIAKRFLQILQKDVNILVISYLFSIMKLGPDYEKWELGVGQHVIQKSICNISGKTEKQVREMLTKMGDLGYVVEKSKGSQTQINKFFATKTPKIEKNVTMEYVFRQLQLLQKQEGNGSATEKERILTELLRLAKPVECKYIIRFIEGNLKIGAAEKTMQSALAKTFQIYHKNKIDGDFDKIINQALCECPNYEKLIHALKEMNSLDDIPKISRIFPGIPCKPMLAKPMKSIQVIMNRFEQMDFTCEYKYDGLRGQIHMDNGKVHIFSRNLENMTETYPDIVQLVVDNFLELDSFIIDSEIVAYDVRTQRILPFQTLTSRARKNVDQNEISIQVCLYLFDLIYIKGESLIQKPLIERRKYLKENFRNIEGKVQFATHIDSNTFEDIEEFLTQSIRAGCEGLMIKTLSQNAQYEPAKRSLNWLKLKKDYLDTGLGDSFDLVPIGALFGAGKRKGVYGSYLLACYNEDMDQYETFCKIGTGFSDELLDKFYNQLQEHIIEQPLEEYKCQGCNMDVWFKPSVVWEVKGADLQKSPVYQACSSLMQGLGLRFPRLIRQRDDKKPTQATTSQQVLDIYKQQAIVQINQDDNDYY